MTWSESDDSTILLYLLYFFFPLNLQNFYFYSQVTYDTSGFLEKNRDLLHLDSIQLLSSCKCHLPQIFGSNMLSQTEKIVVGPLYKSGGADSQKLSVATKFKVILHLNTWVILMKWGFVSHFLFGIVLTTLCQYALWGPALIESTCCSNFPFSSTVFEGFCAWIMICSAATKFLVITIYWAPKHKIFMEELE